MPYVNIDGVNLYYEEHGSSLCRGIVDEDRHTLREEEFNSEQFMQELEDFLREQRKGGGETSCDDLT